MAGDRTSGGFDFFAVGELPAPTLTEAQAERLVADHFGLTARARSLGSQQDANFLLTAADGRTAGVLKVANSAFSPLEIEAQDAAAAHLAAALPRFRFPASDGSVASVGTAGGRSETARVLPFLAGGTLNGSAWLSPQVVGALGRIAGAVGRELRDFEHVGLDRTLQWDLANAGRVVELLARHVGDPHRRAVVDRVRAVEWPRVAALAPALPVQAIHGDITDDNVVCALVDGVRTPDGVIDFGDLMRSWAVGELAVTISSVLHHDGAGPLSVLPAVRGFHAERPLTDPEIDALWPLVLLRGAVLVASGNHQAALDEWNEYATAGLEPEWRILEVAASVPSEVMTRAFRLALGHHVPPAALPGAWSPLLTGAPVAPAVLDLSIDADGLDGGAWLRDSIEDDLAAGALRAGADAVTTRFVEYRGTRAVPLTVTAPATSPTGIDVWFAEDTVLGAPCPGRLVRTAGELRVEGAEATLLVAGRFLPDQPPSRVDAGDELLRVPRRTRIRLTVVVEPGQEPVPPFVDADTAPSWRTLLADPTALLRLPPPPATAPVADPELLHRRAASFATVQEHYYREPPRIERGWRHHLLDTRGRSYLDMVNNVAVLGHGHVGVADAVARQLRRLNTNSRFHYASVVEFSERLAALLPDPLDTVFLVNSGSEAVDLALRIATVATGRTDVVAVREAYHGWTYASDAVSTSIADNPNALSTRPAWVHVVDAPNSYRGTHRGAEASRYGSEAAAEIDRLAAAGRPPAAFVAEPYYGNAGGVALPDGYLGEVYAAVRRHGGMAIADEVQVGYGRLGHWFWGFEQQGVVPDVVTIAKAMGNGHPLGAVITSRVVAERFRGQGYFFSSPGGSPVSCVVGTAVLDAIERDGLQRNALEVGGHLKHRLESLAQQHPLIGAVHGSGLYLGVEFVRDRDALEPATAETAAICDRLLDLGVIMQPTGDHSNVLKIKSPLYLDRAGADFFVDALDRVLAHGFGRAVG